MSSWLRWLSKPSSARRRRAGPRAAIRPGLERLGGRFRAELERLEERIVPSYATGAISAVTINGTEYVLVLVPGAGSGSDVFLNIAQGQWRALTSCGCVQEITAGVDSGGGPDVFALTTSNDVFKDGTSTGGNFIQLTGGGAVQAITGGTNGAVFALDFFGDPFVVTGPGEAAALGGPTFSQISASDTGLLFGLDFNGNIWEFLGGSSGFFQISDSSTFNGDSVVGIRAGAGDSCAAITFGGNVWLESNPSFPVVNWSEIYNGGVDPTLGSADNVAVGAVNGQDVVFITNSSTNLASGQDIFVVSPAFGITPTNITGCACVGDIAADNAGDIYFSTSDEQAPSNGIEPNDLFVNNLTGGGGWVQLSFNGLLTDPSDSNVF